MSTRYRQFHDWPSQLAGAHIRLLVSFCLAKSLFTSQVIVVYWFPLSFHWYSQPRHAVNAIDLQSLPNLLVFNCCSQCDLPSVLPPGSSKMAATDSDNKACKSHGAVALAPECSFVLEDLISSHAAQRTLQVTERASMEIFLHQATARRPNRYGTL